MMVLERLFLSLVSPFWWWYPYIGFRDLGKPNPFPLEVPNDL
jgi:hypothetical protein